MARLLIVDDEPLFLESLGEILQLAGYEVVPAPEGETALRLARQHAFDLAIIDIYMPKMDGLQLMQVLRRERPELPIIAISGRGLDVPIDELPVARRLGATQVFDKPVNYQSLLEAVRTLLAGDPA